MGFIMDDKKAKIGVHPILYISIKIPWGVVKLRVLYFNADWKVSFQTLNF